MHDNAFQTRFWIVTHYLSYIIIQVIIDKYLIYINKYSHCFQLNIVNQLNLISIYNHNFHVYFEFRTILILIQINDIQFYRRSIIIGLSGIYCSSEILFLRYLLTKIIFIYTGLNNGSIIWLWCLSLDIASNDINMKTWNVYTIDHDNTDILNHI